MSVGFDYRHFDSDATANILILFLSTFFTESYGPLLLENLVYFS